MRQGSSPCPAVFLILLLGISWPGASQAQLFDNLLSLSDSIPVGSGQSDPASGKRLDGPKWICADDFDRDGKPDFATCHLNGEIYVGWGRGDGLFDGPGPVPSGVSDLRAIVAGDFNGDGRPDLAAAAPFDGVVTLLFSVAPRGFAPPVLVPTYKRGRNLEPGDFDGDGRLDLAVAGPDEAVSGGSASNQTLTGVMHLRNTGGGVFVVAGTVPEIGLPNLGGSNLRPVFSLEAFRRPGENRDALAVTHQQSAAIWILQTGTNGALRVTDTLSWFGNQAQLQGASPYHVDALKIGTLFSPAATGRMDLIAVMQQA